MASRYHEALNHSSSNDNYSIEGWEQDIITVYGLNQADVSAYV